MKFYNRDAEIELLCEIEENSENHAQMTILLGRRRVGKTTLLKNAFQKSKEVVYFFVAKKNELLLCEEFVREVEERLGFFLGNFQSFSQLFKALMIQSKNKNFTVIIDEFQEFQNINSSIFSDIQNIWDSYKDDSKINLICCGSVYLIMKKIFENNKEPLYGRATSKIILKPFTICVMKQILEEYNPNYKNEDLLAFYMVTGGIAKYVEQLILNKAFTKNKIFDTIFKHSSFFIDEGRAVLVDEFGKDYGNYFSILSLIASSKNERSEIESILNMEIGGYLDRLEKDFNIIKRIRPFGAKEGSRNNKYKIEDNFLSFWFRFIYKYRSAIEIGNLEYVKKIVERDYETFSGFVLENYFRAVLAESNKFSEIGNYWNKKGENEIDIIAVNDYEQIIAFYEIKRHKKRINLFMLEEKSIEIASKYHNYTKEYIGLSLEDM
jgi:AAA+ ATPase superfamily predicted ATPase